MLNIRSLSTNDKEKCKRDGKEDNKLKQNIEKAKVSVLIYKGQFKVRSTNRFKKGQNY